MKIITLISASFLAFGALLVAEPFSVGNFGRKADRLEDKRVEKKLWSKPKQSSLKDKTFPIKQWDKHFSTLGSKKAPIALNEKKKKERFEYKVLDRKTVEFEMSRWDDRMSDLYKRADIQMDDEARSLVDRRLYDKMLQDAKPYKEMRRTLSLRDINRFQFRRNHSSDAIPVEKAGSGEE